MYHKRGTTTTTTTTTTATGLRRDNMIDTNVEQPHICQSPTFQQSKVVASPSLPPPPPPEDVSPETPTHSSIPSSSPCGRKRRVVQFNSTIHNRPIPHLDDMTQEEVAAKWIQPKEYLEIRNRCVSTVQKMMNGSLNQIDLECGFHCTRGLEGKTREGAKKRRDNKIDSIMAVLEEQCMQWNENVDDEEALMEVYSIFSIPCGMEAHLMGLEDEIEAAKYMKEDSALPAPSENNDACVETEEFLGSVAKQERSESIPQDNSGRQEETGSLLVGKLKEIFLQKSNRAALLKDIETTYFVEASIERRRRAREEADAPGGGTQQKEASEASSKITPDECFTTQLRDIFHSRKRRQALLDEIESRYHKARDSGNQMGISKNVTFLSQSLGNKLREILYTRGNRMEVLNELGANSSHMRQ